MTWCLLNFWGSTILDNPIPTKTQIHICMDIYLHVMSPKHGWIIDNTHCTRSGSRWLWQTENVSILRKSVAIFFSKFPSSMVGPFTWTDSQTDHTGSMVKANENSKLNQVDQCPSTFRSQHLTLGHPALQQHEVELSLTTSVGCFTFSYENDVESVKKRPFNKQEITSSKEQVTRLPLTSAFKEWMIQWSSIHKTSYTQGTLLPDSLPSSSRIAGSTQLLHLDAIRNTFAFWHSCFRGKKWATRRHQHFGKRWPRHWKVDRWCFWRRLGECLWGHNTDLSFFGAFFGFWLCFGLEKTDKLVTENEAFEICVGMSWGLWHHCSFSCSIRLPFRQSPQPKLVLLLHLCPSNFVRTKPNERQTASQMVVWPPTSFLVIFPWAPDSTIPAGLIKIGRETSVELLATARETKGGEWSFKAVRDEYLSNARMQKCNGKEYRFACEVDIDSAQDPL